MLTATWCRSNCTRWKRSACKNTLTQRKQRIFLNSREQIEDRPSKNSCMSKTLCRLLIESTKCTYQNCTNWKTLRTKKKKTRYKSKYWNTVRTTTWPKITSIISNRSRLPTTGIKTLLWKKLCIASTDLKLKSTKSWKNRMLLISKSRIIMSECYI